MSKLFVKSYLLCVLSLSAINFSLTAEGYFPYEFECYDPCGSGRTYIGGFGGGLDSNSASVIQRGVALFDEELGGPLAVEAHGKTQSTWAGFGGAQLGHEWTNRIHDVLGTCFNISPAVEIEGYWYSRNLKGHIYNTTDTDRLPEHDFLDTFHMNAGVYLVNAVFSVNHSDFQSLSPYVGLGVGATRLSLKNAQSLQVAPLEAGINHFNSDKHDASWALAAQVKAGLRYSFWESFHIFGEYRYLYVDFSNYIFGSTVYPTHVHTTPWNVKVNYMQYNAFAFGLQYDL